MVLLTWLVSSWVYTISGTFKSRVVSYAKAPAGTEMCMFQRFNLSTEPYSTALSRKPGGGWGWFYFDHEDHAWLSGGIILNTTNKITDIFRGDKKVAYYDWANDQFVHLIRGATNGPGEITSARTPPPSAINP